MSTAEVLPLTVERMDDLAAVINPKRNPNHCWCLAYRMNVKELEPYADRGGREAAMRDLAAGPTPPGLIAYRDGEPVGWVGMGPRAEVRRLARSTVIPRVDDLPVWSVFCLVVRTGYRRQGVTKQLIEGAVAYAAQQNAPAVEAYPVDPGQGRVNSSFAYVGTTSMFEKAGFVRVRQTASTSDGMARWLMRRPLTAT